MEKIIPWSGLEPVTLGYMPDPLSTKLQITYQDFVYCNVTRLMVQVQILSEY